MGGMESNQSGGSTGMVRFSSSADPPPPSACRERRPRQSGALPCPAGRTSAGLRRIPRSSTHPFVSRVILRFSTPDGPQPECHLL